METEGWSCRAVRTDDVSHSIILQMEEKYIHLKTNQCLNYIFCHIWLLKVELLTADQPVTVRRTNPLTAVITLIAAPLIALCEPLKCKQITDSPFYKAEVDSSQSLRYRSEVLKNDTLSSSSLFAYMVNQMQVDKTSRQQSCSFTSSDSVSDILYNVLVIQEMLSVAGSLFQSVNKCF